MGKINHNVYLLLIIIVILLLLLIFNKTINKELFTDDIKFHHRAIKNIKVAPLSKLPSEYDPLKDEVQTTSEGFRSKVQKKKNRITAFDNIEVFDQGYSYTCVANAISSALQVFLRNKHNYDVPSRTFIYSICKYNNYSRWDCNYDTVYTPGLEDSNALQTCNKYVIPNEKTLPFPPLSLLNSGDGGALCSAIPDNLIIKPSNRTIKFREIPRGTNQIRQAIDAGHPVIIDILLYSSSLKADTDKNHLGFIPLPDFKKDQYWGGHTLVIIGYDDKTQLLKLRNSWGKNYGNHTGDYTISYHYIWSNTLDNSGYTATTGLWEIIDYS